MGVGETEAKAVCLLVVVLSVEGLCLGAPIRRLSWHSPKDPCCRSPMTRFSSNSLRGFPALPPALHTSKLSGIPPHILHVLQEPRCLAPLKRP